MPILFTPEMDWSSPLIQEPEYETVITEFYDGSEQREGLMETPHLRLSFAVTAGDVEEANLIETLIYAGQAAEFWVPYWRGASWLGTARSIGATTLTLDTIRRGYQVGQGVMFRRDALTAEVAELSVVTDTSLTFSALTHAWAASGVNRAKVVPVYRGLIAPSVDLDYIERSMKVGRLTFDILPDAD